MSSNLHVIPERGLLALLNEATLHDHTTLQVRYPILDIPLVSIDLGRGVIDVRARREEFDVVEELNLAPQIKFDFPNHGDLMECLLTSKVIPFKNQDELVKKIDKVISDSRDWKVNPKRLYFGMDTNMMYYKYPSRRMLRDTSVCHVYSKGVDNELAASINDKYTMAYIDQLKRVIGGNRPFDALSNVPMKRARKAKSARREVRHIVSAFSGLKAECEELNEKKELNDTKIAQSYARFAKEQNSGIVVLSGDRDFIEKANSHEVGTINVVFPTEVPARAEGDLVAVMHLINDLANAFGIVDLAGLGTRVFGAWKGKTQDQYYDGMLQVIIDPQVKFYEELTNDLAIINGISFAKKE